MKLAAMLMYSKGYHAQDLLELSSKGKAGLSILRCSCYSCQSNCRSGIGPCFGSQNAALHPLGCSTLPLTMTYLCMSGHWCENAARHVSVNVATDFLDEL